MPRGADNRVEVQATNGATEASKRFLARRAFWKTAEVAHDALRYATLPLRLAGNIVKDTFKLDDDMDTDSQLGMVLYAGIVVPMGGLALAGGIAILASNPVGWAVAAGIGLAEVGGAVELPILLWLGTGVVKGTVDTYQHTREKNQSLREKRAARRANWK